MSGYHTVRKGNPDKKDEWSRTWLGSGGWVQEEQ